MFHYSRTCNKHLYSSSSSLIKWKRNKPRWVCSVIHSLSSHWVVSARHQWSNAIGISQVDSVQLFTHFQQTPRPHLLLIAQVAEEQVTVLIFSYLLTFSAHVGPSFSSIIECNRNKPSWLRSIINSLPTNTSTFPCRRSSQCLKHMLRFLCSNIHSPPTITPTPACPRWASGRGTSHGESVLLFIHFQRTRRCQLVINDHMQQEQTEKILFDYSLTLNKYLYPTSSSSTTWKNNKSMWLCSIIQSEPTNTSTCPCHRSSHWKRNESRWLGSVIHSLPANTCTAACLVDTVEEGQVMGNPFRYSLSFTALGSLSSSSMTECYRNKPSWLRSIINSLPTNTSTFPCRRSSQCLKHMLRFLCSNIHSPPTITPTPACPRWARGRGTSHGDSVQLSTHFQRRCRS